MEQPQSPRQPELVDGFMKNMVSIVMPAYNEAQFIAQSLAQVKRQFEPVCPELEIIVVDDGSTDGTSEIVRRLHDNKVKLISYPTNKGKGYAVKTGFQHARGELTFLTDSDSEISPMQLAMFINALRVADVAIGSKRHPLSRVQTPTSRKFLSTALHVIVRTLTGIHVSDTQAGFKGVRSSAMYKIVPLMAVKKFAFDLEFLVLASLLGLKVVELPIAIELKAQVGMRRLLRTAIDILGITYRLRLRKWYQKNIAYMENTYKPIVQWQ